MPLAVTESGLIGFPRQTDCPVTDGLALMKGAVLIVKFDADVPVPSAVVTEIEPVVTPLTGNTAVMEVALATIKDVTSTPLNCTAVAPVKLVPVKVIVGVVPKHAVVGVKLVMVGVRTTV